MRILSTYTNYTKAVKGVFDEFTTNVEEFMQNPTKFDAVLFTGGSDVSPSLYNDRSPKNMCHCNIVRDLSEVRVYVLAAKLGIPMFGICRGAQFLFVMLGGKLVHHLDGHGGSIHDVLLTLKADSTELPINKIKVNSLHHQACLPSAVMRSKVDFLGIASPRLSKEYYLMDDTVYNEEVSEVEAFVSVSKKVFAVQYHPEMMSTTSSGYKWFNGIVAQVMAKGFCKIDYSITAIKHAVGNDNEKVCAV